MRAGTPPPALAPLPHQPPTTRLSNPWRGCCAEELRETLAQETKEENAFAPLPFHYLEVSSLILHA